MKKSGYLVLALVMAFGLAALGYSHAAADFFPGGLPPADPTAVASVKGASLTSAVLPVPDLPGTITLDSGKYQPVGFKMSEAQFEGSGIKVGGLTGTTTAIVCFPFPTARYSWTGSVSQWSGTNWMPLPTTFVKDADGVVTGACTSGAPNGTFALIIWYYGPIESVVTPEALG